MAAPAVSQPVALVGVGGASKKIAAILAGGDFAPACFDGVEGLPEADLTHEAKFGAIVLWLEDTISRVPGLIEPLIRRFEGVPVVLVCADIQRWELRSALAAGAAGVVISDDLKDCLGPCLRAVMVGQVCVPRAHWRQIEPPVLSTREKQILGLVVMGYMNSQIAERLFLAESTVKSHLSSAFGKLGVRSRNEAVELILNPERGLGMGILGLGGEPIEMIPTPEVATAP